MRSKESSRVPFEKDLFLLLLLLRRLFFQSSNVSRKSFLWFNLIGYRRKWLRMRTDHNLLEIVEEEVKKRRTREMKHCIKQNFFSRRMKLPVNRPIEIDQTKFFFFVLIRLICSSALKVSSFVNHHTNESFLRMMMMMIYCEIKKKDARKREDEKYGPMKKMKIKSGISKASIWSLSSQFEHVSLNWAIDDWYVFRSKHGTKMSKMKIILSRSMRLTWSTNLSNCSLPWGASARQVISYNKTFFIDHITSIDNSTLSALTTNSLESFFNIVTSRGIAPALIVQYFPGVMIEILNERKILHQSNQKREREIYMERANAALLFNASLFESSNSTNRSTVPISTARSLPWSDTLEYISRTNAISRITSSSCQPQMKDCQCSQCFNSIRWMFK